MNKIKSLFSIIVIFLFFISAGRVSAGEEIFFIADSIDAPPYKSINSEGTPSGIFHDIISIAFKRMGVPLKYEGYPWKRAQMLVKMKRADALITVPTSQRLEYLVPSKEPVIIARTKLFTQRDNPNIAKIASAKSLDDLQGLKFVDYIGNGWGQEILKQFEVDWLSSITSACKAIAAGIGDVFMDNEVVVWHTIKKIKNNERDWGLRFDHIVSFDAPVPQISFHLLVHKESKYLHLISKFDETIRAMREAGELDKIIDKWIK